MITSDGRSAIEAEVEQMQSGLASPGAQRMKEDCRDHSIGDCSDTSEYNYPPNQRPSRLVRWIENLFRSRHAS